MSSLYYRQFWSLSLNKIEASFVYIHAYLLSLSFRFSEWKERSNYFLRPTFSKYTLILYVFSYVIEVKRNWVQYILTIKTKPCHLSPCKSRRHPAFNWSVRPESYLFGTSTISRFQGPFKFHFKRSNFRNFEISKFHFAIPNLPE
jgi:hypothetical protein